MKNEQNCAVPDAQMGKSGQKQATGSHKPALSLEEEVALLRALSCGTGRGFTEAEASKVMEWASRVRTENNVLELALMGWVKIGFRGDGELIFTAVDPELILAHNGLNPAIGA
jgi:hypothetical protein